MTAPQRRWFRFSLRTLFVLVTLGTAIIWFGFPSDARKIQGNWSSLDEDGRVVLIFQGDSLIGQIGVGENISRTFSTYKLFPREGQIEITRDDGTQQGLYQLDGKTLTLTLSAVNQPGPAAPKPDFTKRIQQFVFERQN